jgi:3-hydroxybutyryl-CoA dehydrogenase
MEIKKVGVVGCGTMGSGIAQVWAQSGYQVVVSEINDELLARGLASINSRLAKSVDKGRLSPEDKDAVLGRIKGTVNIRDFSDCDLIIEAAGEDIDLKKKIFAQLDEVCPEHAILATNTSALSVIDMAVATNRQDKVLGMHFINPAPVMKLVEVVRTIATSDETLETGKNLVKSLGKTPVVVKDSPGFVMNRLLIPFLLGAIRMLEAGVASREDIDAAVTLGLNHPMGPLALSDLIGNDVVFHTASAMYEQFKDPQWASPPLLKKMVAAGWLGRKTGKGFYDYK